MSDYLSNIHDTLGTSLYVEARLDWSQLSAFEELKINESV